MKRLVGIEAPPFTMQALATDAENFTEVSLSDYSGKWLVLFFYPMDFTFVCPTELTAFSKELPAFRAAEAELLSVSTDSVYTHLAWTRNGLGKLGYPMASDQTLEVSASWGVLLEDEGVALRGLFIIDPEGVVRYGVVHDNNVGRNPQEVLRVLQALKTGGLCGANWSLGQQTIDPDQEIEEPPSVSPQDVKGHQVRIYSLPDCSYCHSVKDYLRECGIAFEDIDLSTSKEGQAFMNERGYTALPVTVVDGKEIVGFDMPKIKQALVEVK